jgi:mannitol 2-dehydrogenase
MKHPYLVDLKTLAYPSTIAIKFLMELCIWELVDFIDRTKRFISMIISIRIDDYKKTLIERFSNPKIRDRLPRLCLNGAAKIPKFVLGSLRDKLQLGGAIYYLSLTIAAWCLYLNG